MAENCPAWLAARCEGQTAKEAEPAVRETERDRAELAAARREARLERAARERAELAARDATRAADRAAEQQRAELAAARRDAEQRDRARQAAAARAERDEAWGDLLGGIVGVAAESARQESEREWESSQREEEREWISEEAEFDRSRSCMIQNSDGEITVVYGGDCAVLQKQ